MNAIEIFLLELGSSWFLSKLLPYVLTLILGVFLFAVFKKLLKGRRFQYWLSIPFIVLPFLIYFAFYPIYEGDFSNNYRTSNEKDILPNNGERKLVIVAIPNCPFCFESIHKLKLIHKRNPELPIEFLVCTENEADLMTYKQEAQNSFVIKKQTDYKKLVRLAHSKFPTFLLFEENGIIKIWNNDSFGVRAVDEVENN
jgi:hypothetical protein